MANVTAKLLLAPALTLPALALGAFAFAGAAWAAPQCGVQHQGSKICAVRCSCQPVHSRQPVHHQPAHRTVRRRIHRAAAAKVHHYGTRRYRAYNYEAAPPLPQGVYVRPLPPYGRAAPPPPYYGYRDPSASYGALPVTGNAGGAVYNFYYYGPVTNVFGPPPPPPGFGAPAPGGHGVYGGADMSRRMDPWHGYDSRDGLGNGY